MTGSISRLSRQHSETATNSNMEKVQKHEKPRRSSSAEDQRGPLEVILDFHEQKEVFFAERERRTTDYDSGTEEIEQQLEQKCFSAINTDEDEPSGCVATCNADEGYSENESDEKSKLLDIKNDLNLVKTIPDEIKKDFCQDTTEAFHAEFARRISIPLSLDKKVRYYLFAKSELPGDFFSNRQGRTYGKLDNAKAQFKCTERRCQHAWTSMRARILFTIYASNPGFVVLEILGQDCEQCGTYVEAVWYVDEVCRVMKNLAQCIFELFFPDMLYQIESEPKKAVQIDAKQAYLRRHDPMQRKGKMMKPHQRRWCEACRRGICYI
ncbi:unnamed protein product [Adineta ricciae]|uniref:3CxxC-type domain-containing protein n=1 Tax=Adineta ricciae TaxID=249248 RepID=A0A815GD56_ADIRI|nr:unnamed protein product [Adineta ricciae]CAF1337183.1 unnamed protein product [Adineta ricciae]